jgi:hypothetical protein
MPGSYARGTTTTPAASRAEIERTLVRFGAREYAFIVQADSAAVVFRVSDRQVRFAMMMPDFNERRFKLTEARQLRRSAPEQRRLWEQACAERWRALAAGIKAKFAMVEAGITTVEEEFLAHTVMPDGRTVGQHALPAVARAIADNEMPALLMGPVS